MKSPKKIIGSLGRRYGGRPFQVVRKFCYDTVDYTTQLLDVSYLLRKKFRPGSTDRLYFRKHYNGRDISQIKEGVVCMCDGTLFHGGISDRMRGILSTYAVTRRRGIPFYISWTAPFNLEDYLLPAGFDWRISSEDLSHSPRQAFPVIIQDLSDSLSSLRLWAALVRRRPQTHVFNDTDNCRGHYAALYREIFRPSPALQREVDRHLDRLGDNYHAFTFRFLQLLGDFTDWLQVTLSDEEATELMAKVKTEFLRLAVKVPPHSRILVTSDSRRFLDYIKDADERIYIVPGNVKNIDLLKGEKHPGAWMKTFVDQQLLMKARRVTLMRTGQMYRSGFPRLAAEIGGAEYIDHVF